MKRIEALFVSQLLVSTYYWEIIPLYEENNVPIIALLVQFVTVRVISYSYTGSISS